MKTSTLRLARRLAAKVELDDIQQALMEDAYGARDWGSVFFDDQFSVRQFAQKRRELRSARSAHGERSRPMGDADPLDVACHTHSPEHPVASDIDVGDLAVCLMILPGLVATGARALVAALSTAQPIVAVRGNARGFERRFGCLLESLVRTKRRPLKIVRVDDPSELVQKHGNKKSNIITLHIRSDAFDGATPAQIRRCLTMAMRAQTPIVVTSEKPGFAFPVHVSCALDMTIDAASLDWSILAELIDAKTGIDADQVLAAASTYPIDLTRLSLDDLTLAIRPGRKLEMILDTLAQLAASPSDEQSDENDNSKNRKTTSSGRNRNGTSGTGSIRIDPQPLPSTAIPGSQRPIGTAATVTTPAGVADVATADIGNGGTANAIPVESDDARP